MADRLGILAGGHWVIDHVKMIDAWPPQDALASITSQRNANGGCAYNLLKDLSLMGARFPLQGAGLISHDPDGEAILRDCDALGIDRTRIRQTDAAPTSYTDVMTVASTGRRTFFYQRGANAILSEEHFDLRSSNARIFHLGYFCLLDALDRVGPGGRNGHARLLERASAMGFITSADMVSNETADFPAIVGPSLPHLDYLIANEFEIGRLTGRACARDGHAKINAVMAAAREVLERGVRRAVVVHFREGAVIVPRDGKEIRLGSVAVPAERIRGAAGAGDAFAAGLLFGIHEAWPLDQALELGVCVAAASLEDATCSGSIRPWRVCLQMGRLLGYGNQPLAMMRPPNGARRRKTARHPIRTNRGRAVASELPRGRKIRKRTRHEQDPR
ncbi:MAG TPA: carbohydrate kinase family protein [Verrucomicrobiae bacterium]|nr:carbohydrate kinase family protein [Verrucomicrobiae bacterium]